MNNIDWAKKRVQTLVGRNIVLKVNKGRNKFVTFNGKIDSVYPSVFTVKIDEAVKSYSYTDVLTKTVRFFPDINENIAVNGDDTEKNDNAR